MNSNRNEMSRQVILFHATTKKKLHVRGFGIHEIISITKAILRRKKKCTWSRVHYAVRTNQLIVSIHTSGMHLVAIKKPSAIGRNIEIIVNTRTELKDMID